MIGPTIGRLDVELTELARAEVLIVVGTIADANVVELGTDRDDTLELETGAGVGVTTGADVGEVAGVEAGFAGAAVFWKQAHALDKREAGSPARLLGTFSLGAVRNFGQKAAASLEKRSRVRRALSSKQVNEVWRCT